MGLINKFFEILTLEEFDKTIADLHSVSLLCIPRFGGRDEDAVEFVLDIKIARDAIGEIKRLVYGAGETDGAVDFERFPLEQYDETVAGMFGLEMVVIPSFAVEIGCDAVAEYAIACMIAKDAIIEIKQQVYGVERDV